jgi:hypothetical protein
MSTPQPTPTWPANGNTFTSNTNPDTFKALQDAYGWNGTTSTALGLTPQQKNLSFKDVDGKEQTPQCPKADDIPMNDSSNDIEKILKETGASQQCVKESDLYAKETSGSMRVKVDAFLASADAEAKFMSQEKNERKRQVGCGALLVTSTNIVSKQKAMQCIVNSCKQNTNISASAGASVTIQTLPLTDLQAIQLAKLNSDILDQNTQTIDSDNMLLKGASIDKLDILTKFINNRTKLIKESQQQQLALYDRAITIRGTSIRVAATTNIAATIALSTEAQNKLSSLANDISKDVAQMEVANKLGVNAQDPNVKQIVNQNSSKSISTTSSSITDIAQNTTIKAEAGGNIKIVAPGIITLENTTIDADICATVVVQQIMAQAVSNGLTLASQTLTDNKSIGKVLNDVKGLDDYQNAVNDAIRAGTDASPSFGQGSGSFLKMALIGGAVLIGLVVLVNFIPKGGSQQQPIILSKFGGYRLNSQYRMNSQYDSKSGYKYAAVVVVLLLLFTALFFGLRKLRNN